MTDRRTSPPHPKRASRSLRPLGTCWLLALACIGLPALAAPRAGSAETPAAQSAQSRYQRDKLACMRLRPRDERANCMREASAVLADTHPNRVDSDPGRYARNALERCKPLREPDRSDCVARMQGQGSTSGSVAGGGITRELVTRDAAEPVKP